MTPFKPFPDRPEQSLSYYTVPAEVLEDSAELGLWARRSLAAALQAPRRKSRGGRRLRKHMQRSQLRR
jgi:TfoX/Sxy family transcriptional regulator of competence genes